MKKLNGVFLLGLFLMFNSSSVISQCTLNPPLNLGPDFSGCAGSSHIMNAGSGYTDYVWSNGDTSQSITATTSDIYFVYVTDSFGCVGVDSVNVSISLGFNVDLGPDVDACSGQTTILDAGAGPFVYQWQNGTTDQTYLTVVGGTFWVEVSDSNGCKERDTIEVTYHGRPAAPVITGGDTAICQGDPAFLSASAGFSSYDWSNGAAGQTISVTLQGSYSVIGVDSFGCVSPASGTVAITVNPRPVQPIITWDGVFFNTTASPDLQWFRDGNAIPGATGSNYMPTLAGDYTVQSTNSDGCPSPFSAVFTPSLALTQADIVQVFSPNGDGINEIFYIPNIQQVPENVLTILNRWGQEVFRASPYQNEWTGKHSNGNELPPGAYYYVLDLRNGEKPFKGYVEIRR